MATATGSKYISHATIAPAELARSPVGTTGIYFIAERDDMKPSEVLQKARSLIKSYFSRENGRCELYQGRFLTGLNSPDDELRAMHGMLAVVTKEARATDPSEKRAPLPADTTPGTRVTFRTNNQPDLVREGEFLTFSTQHVVIVRTEGGDKRIHATRVQLAD